jgi:dTMP kinase
VKLCPETVIILEGLDRTGKTTQRDRLTSLAWADPKPAVTHMPSGLAPISEAIYRLTEQEPITSLLARQLLHLACHAENIPKLLEVRADRAVIIDRWWWSTVAYGWFGAELRSHLDEDSFLGAIDMIWRDFSADLVFLFLTPYENDVFNGPAVRQGYQWLADRHPDITVEVPADDPESTTGFLIGQLRDHGLLSE